MVMYIGKQLGSLWELTLALMLPIYIFINIKMIILIICIYSMKGELLSKLQHVFRLQDDLISFNDH